MSTCPAPEELASLALGQLEPDAAASLQAHLNQCPACQQALAEWTDLLGLLPLAEPPVAPPPDLKRRILATVAEETPAAANHRTTYRRWLGLVAAVALMLGGYAALRVDGVIPPVHQTEPAQAVRLDGVGPGTGATAWVSFERSQGGTRVHITAEGLPPLQPGEVYQLWAVKNGKRWACGNFTVDQNGRGEGSTWIAWAVTFDTLGITREPDASGVAPRGPKVLGTS
jgi:anti-sigma-K factor RskA